MCWIGRTGSFGEYMLFTTTQWWKWKFYQQEARGPLALTIIPKESSTGTLWSVVKLSLGSHLKRARTSIFKSSAKCDDCTQFLPTKVGSFVSHKVRGGGAGELVMAFWCSKYLWDVQLLTPTATILFLPHTADHIWCIWRYTQGCCFYIFSQISIFRHS